MTVQNLRLPRGLVGAIANQGVEPLSEDQMRKLAPSIFAEGKHESRSERYAYIPTIDVVRGLMREGFEPMKVQQGRSRIEGKAAYTKHLIRFTHGTAEMRQVGDTRPEIVLINSHDGTSSYRIVAGLFRLVCLNGLVAADSLIGDVKVGHSGKVVDKVIDGTWSVVSQVDRIMERPAAWQGVELTGAEAYAFARAAHTLRFDEEQAVGQALDPAQLLTARRDEDVGMSLWQTFNRVQENAVKGGLGATVVTRQDDGGYRSRHVQTQPIRAIDGDVKLNRALWVLAEEMAKIKG